MTQPKVIIFNGPKYAFENKIKTLPSYNTNKTITLTQLALDMDANRRQFIMTSASNPKVETREKPHFTNLIVYAEEYSGVTESVVNSFMHFISECQIDTIILQNPPRTISEQLHRKLEQENIQDVHYEYQNISQQNIDKFVQEAPKRILNQPKAIEGMHRALIARSILTDQNKPFVVMLYGPSGTGKTETAKCLANLLDGVLFYKQFSMFQNNGSMEYLFGTSYSSSCFAKDLLNRESNILLFDEFDKANTYVYASLYQLFDEGIFMDNNFTVHLGGSFIICTSNFTSPEDILKKLGSPMFNRINCLIKYSSLSTQAIQQIIINSFNKSIKSIDCDIRNKINTKETLNLLLLSCRGINNARQIHHLVQEVIAGAIINASS